MTKVITIAVVSSWLIVSATGGAAQETPAGKRPTGERVTHYAFLSTGPAYGEGLSKLYWGVNDGMHRVLLAYGYPEEAIYRFGDYGDKKPPNVDGKATLKNFRATLDHLQEILTPGDHVFFMVVGHGRPEANDYCHLLLDGKLTATEFGQRLSRLPTDNLTVVIHPCHSGGFLPRVSRRNCVVVTSVNADEVNNVPWAEAFIEAFAKSVLPPASPPGPLSLPLPASAASGEGPQLGPEPFGSDPGGASRVSILDAYHAALKPGKDRYGSDLKEHPLLDDNGDRMGTYLGTNYFLNGDGRLAARRFLGREGSKLEFSEAAIRNLRRANARLVFE